ncbi:MAG: tetratricopeptide repeat protein [Planctomycetota bacterium]|nr:tetratricopeptide repeat protein [Planctomycetota bacterium]
MSCRRSPLVGGLNASWPAFISGDTIVDVGIGIGSTIRNRSRIGIGCGLLVALAAIALYLPSLDNEFVDFDDTQYVTNNFYVLHPSWQNLWTCFSEVWRPSNILGYYQPLTIASLMLDRVIDGRFAGSPTAAVAPYVFHMTNALLHGLNAVLVFVLARFVSRRIGIAVICGLLFAAHPLNVEVVSWVSQRKTLLSTTFALSALICHGRYSKTSGAGWYLLTWASFVLSLLSKPTGLLLPLVLILADVWPLRRISLRSVIQQVPLLVTAVVFGWISVVSQVRTAGLELNAGVWATFLILCQNVVFYSSRLLIPFGQSPVHPMPGVGAVALAEPTFLFGLIGSAVLVGLSVVAWRRGWTSIGVCVAAFFVLLAPAMSPWRFMIPIVAERFVYLPMIGPLMLLAAGLRRLWAPSRGRRSSGRRISTVGCGLAIGCFAFLTIDQQRVWRNSRALYEAVTTRYPNHPYGYCALGTLYLNEHELIITNGSEEDLESAESLLSAAMGEYVRALRLDPAFGRAHFRVAQTLLLQGDPEAALAHFEGHPEAFGFNRANYFYGQALDRLGDKQGAIMAFRECLSREPDLRDARRQLARLLLEKGQTSESLTHFDKLGEQGMFDADTLHNWAVALVEVGRLPEALARLADVEKMRIHTVSESTGDRLSRVQSKLADTRYAIAGILAMMEETESSFVYLRAAVSQKRELLAAAGRNAAFERLRGTEAWRLFLSEFEEVQ